MNQPSSQHLIPPFAIHILWNAKEEKDDGNYIKYIKPLYQFFNRSVDDPLDVLLGIPVYLYPSPDSFSITKIAESSSRSCFLLLTDLAMLNNDSWKEKIEQIGLFVDENNAHLLLTLALTKRKNETLDKAQKILVKTQKIDITNILIRLTHSISRHLSGIGESTDTSIKHPTPEVKVFISHAKADGAEFAMDLKDQIDEIPELSSFFDAKDIPAGSDFEQIIMDGIDRSILLVLHSDKYSSREWCRREIIWAKERNKTVLVLNQFEDGERRSFPYLGNVPHLHYPKPNTEKEYKELQLLVILNLLSEDLRLRLSNLAIKALTNHLELKDKIIFGYPPELLTVLNLGNEDSSLIIYPDPPLGIAEQEVLRSLKPSLTFLTPTSLPLYSPSNKIFNDLNGLKVSLSLSELKEYDRFAWVRNNVIQDTTAAITRHLLFAGSTVQYGGSLHYADKEEKSYNFAKLLLNLVKTYSAEFEYTGSSVVKPIENYLCYPIYTQLSEEEEEDLSNLANFHRIEVDKLFNLSPKYDLEVLSWWKKGRLIGKLEKRIIWAYSLADMRTKMIAGEDARIVMGGKWTNYVSRMPGILEEVFLTLKANKPLYVVGGFGGVSTGVAAMLQGRKVPEMNLKYQAKADSGYQYFYDQFNQKKFVQNKNWQFSYKEIVDFLNERRKENDFGLNNGLSRKDNERLFNSNSSQEVVCLLLKGLKKIKKEKS